MIDPPSNLRVLKELRLLEIHWPDGSGFQIPFHTVRASCRCAGCVDEMTGVRTLNVHSIPAEIHPTNVGFSGNYALRIVWSDGHSTGLYTWNHLQELCQSPEARRITP